MKFIAKLNIRITMPGFITKQSSTQCHACRVWHFGERETSIRYDTIRYGTRV